MSFPTFPMRRPFDYLIAQIQTDLDHAAQLCKEIKKIRDAESHDQNLDQLEKALSAGSSFVRSQAAGAEGLEGADIDGGDDIARATMARFLAEVGEIGSELESMVSPPTYRPGHDPQLQRSRFFPTLGAPTDEEKHGLSFHDMLLKWERIHDGIVLMFDELKLRLAKKVRDEEDKKMVSDDAEKSVQRENV